MPLNQALPILTPIINRMPIIMRRLSRTRHRVAKLPEQIPSHTRILQTQTRLLPAALNWTMVRLLRHTVFLKKAGLVEPLADRGMCLDPTVAEGVAHAPAVRVEVECSEIYVWQG